MVASISRLAPHHEAAIESRIGLRSARARAKAGGPQGSQATDVESTRMGRMGVW